MTLPHRPRRLRRTPALRRMVRETRLHPEDLIQPLFVDERMDQKAPITSMPGVFRHSPKSLLEEAKEVFEAGVPAIILFGIPNKKDEKASEAYNPEGIVQTAIREIKKEVPRLVVITDVCLCEYMSHGHCGIVENDEILNDPSLELLAQTAVSHAAAGADIVAPSDMMDGRVARIRTALDQDNFSHVPIMAYAVKYASAFYGPFREAADSAPQFGDRASYQMDPANIREALHEAELDVSEGADILMVKPALPYLDILTILRQQWDLPLATYHVSGEYTLIKAAAEKGWIDEKKLVLETLTSIKRAGANLILTYYAKDVAGWL